MPLKFWDEAFLTTIFLINCLPSKVIHNISPLEHLLGKKPDYSFLWTFGCACWPNLRPYNTKNFNFVQNDVSSLATVTLIRALSA
jgi:histone deacetylase 1/2